MKRPVESDYLSGVAYTRALEAYCDSLEQREWVGLTDEDIDDIRGGFPHYASEWDEEDYNIFARAGEAKLKEKNT